MNIRYQVNRLSCVILSLAMSALSSLAAPTESIFPESVTPDTRPNDAPSWELGTIFRPTASGKMTGARVFSLADESGAHAVRVWQNSPEVLLFSTNWNFGGNEAWINLPIPALPLQANTDYTISISAPAEGWYPANAHYFDAAGNDGQNLSYPQAAGVFSDTAGNRPTSAWNNTAYLRDIVFEPNAITASGGGTVLGNQTANTVQTLPAGQITGSRFQALRNLRLNQIGVRVAQLTTAGGSAMLKAAVYSDNGGAPNLLLGSTAELSNPTNGWYSLPLTAPVNALVFSNYWLVVWVNADQASLYANTNGRELWNSYSYGGTWPSPLDLSGGSGNGTLCLYAEGTPSDATGPEMQVQGNGVWIAPGGTNVSSANATDLGGASVYGGSVTQTFTIRNIGQGSLALSGTPIVTVTGPQASEFVVTTPPAASVPAGGSTSFTVKFTPTAGGNRQATLQIAHADSPANPYSFAIQGEGLPLSGAGILGNYAVGTDSRPIGAVITGNRFMAPGNLRITALRAKIIKSSGNFACAVYADNQGVPGHLLAASAIVSADTNGWNSYALSAPLDVTAGSYYWLMLASDSTAAAIQMEYIGTGYIAAGTVTDLNAWPEPLLLTAIQNEPRTYCIYAEGLPITPAPGAAMDVRGGGNLIASGQILASTLDGTDYGTVAINTGTVDHSFTIQNSGSAPLQLTGTPPVVITGAQAGDFQITAQPTSPVAAGGSTTFTVRFTPSASGLRTATVGIANNDIDGAKNPYQFAVQGAGFVVGRQSLFPDSQVGADVDNDGTQYELGVIFQSKVAGSVTALRVFSVTGDTGAHSAYIWSTADQSMVAGPFDWDFGGVTGWIYLDIPPVSIQPGVQYTVDVSTGQGRMHDYANIAGILTDAGDNGLDLSYPPSAGVFVEGLGSMPSKTWNGSSYLRDVVFVPQGTTAKFPVMGLLGNGLTIPDGYSSPAGTNNTDFGTTSGTNLSFVITNSGSAPLNLTGTPLVAITGAQAADFKLATPPTTPIPAGGSSTFTIRFAPAASGLRRATVAIQNDDKNPFYFAISGTGAPMAKITAITPDRVAGSITLQWQSPSAQVQIERASAVNGYYTPIGGPQTGTIYTDVGVMKSNTAAFYQLRY